MKNLTYLLILSAFIAVSVLSLNMIVFQVSLHRIIILIIPFLIIYLAKKKSMKVLPPPGRSRKIVLFFVFWFVYALISVIWVKDFYAWARAVYFITAGMLGVIWISMIIKEKKDLITVFNIIQLMVILHNVIGWFDIITLDYTYLDYPRLDYFVWLLRVGRHPISLMGNTNNFALLLTFGVFISFICFKNSQSKFWKAVSIITIASSLALNLMTESRANLIGMIMGVGVFLLVYLIKSKKLKKYLLISAPIVIVLGILVAVGMPSVYQKMFSILNKVLFFDFNSTDGSDPIRVNLIRNGFVFLKQTFGFGTGAGNIEYWMENRAIYNTLEVVNMHNWWMEILTGYGVLVFVGYMWMYVTMAKGFFTAYMHSEDEFIQNVSVGLLCCMVAFLLGGISSSSNITQEWLWIFWGVVVGTYCYIDCRVKVK